MTVPTSPSSGGLAVAAVMVVVVVTAVAVTAVAVTPISVVGPREDAGWDGAGCRGGPAAEGGARLPCCQLSGAVAAQDPASPTPTAVPPRTWGLSAGSPPELAWRSRTPGNGPPGWVPTVGLTPRTPQPVPGEGCGVGNVGTEEPLVGAGCGNRGMWGDPGVVYGTLLCTPAELPGATEVGGCPSMAGRCQVWSRGTWLCSGGLSLLGGPKTRVVRSRAPPRPGDVTPAVLAVVLGTGRLDPLPAAGSKVEPIPVAGWAVLATGPPRPPVPRDDGEGRGAERGPCQATSIPCHGRESEPCLPAGLSVPPSGPVGVISLCSPPAKGDIPIVPGAGLSVASVMLECVPGLLSPSGMVAPRPSTAHSSGDNGLREPLWLCTSAVPMGVHPGRVLGDPRCPRADPGTVMEDGEYEGILCGVVAPSAVTFPTGSVPGGYLVVGAVSGSMGAGGPTLVTPRLAGDGGSLPAAACSAVPAESGAPGCSMAAPSCTVGPVPSLPAQGPAGLPWGLGASAVLTGVPGKGSSSASVCCCPVVSGIGARPVPAPRSGSMGRGRSGGMLSRADTQPAPHSHRLGTPGPSVALVHVAGMWCHRQRAMSGTVPAPAVPVWQRSPTAVPGWAQGMAVPSVESVPLPRPGQSRAQHSTITGETAAHIQASCPSVGHQHRAPTTPGSCQHRQGGSAPPLR